MLNGDGLRTVLWVAGCEHHCPNCQNPVTWDINGGIEFDNDAEEELFKKLSKPYISGITLSGGDPLHPQNRAEVARLIHKIKAALPEKTVWVYTGYDWEDVRELAFMSEVDVLVDGKFDEKLKDIKYHWAGSRNQRVIEAKNSLQMGKVILH